jgi:glycosyltransferase involved in cell wall biosynthesis
VIVDLLGDDKRRAAIGACARQTVLDHFSWDSVCEQTIQVYKSVSEKKLNGGK